MTTTASAVFESWNAAEPDTAVDILLTCCGSPLWARALVSRRPYVEFGALLADAEASWFAQPEAEWLAAFACHPRIGSRTHHASPQFAAWSNSEQGVARETLGVVEGALAEANAAYERRFGFIYLVFANGRTAPELLDILQERLTHERDAELIEAARQQWLITRLRLGRAFEPEGGKP